MDQDELDAIAELKAMPVDQLEQVPHENKKWVCQFKGCLNGTTVWDFGIAPEYFHPRKSIQWTRIGPGISGGWHWWMCGKHNKFYKRLKKKFDEQHVKNKLFDWSKERIVDIISKQKTAEDYE